MLEYKNREKARIISLADDVKNIDYAIKLKSVLAQNNIRKYKIFVRVMNYDSSHSDLIDSDDIVFFGNNYEIINKSMIINEELYELAKMLKQSYEIKRLSEINWYRDSFIKQRSNFYLSLNMKVKINLLGYDLKPIKASDKENVEEINKKLLTELQNKIIPPSTTYEGDKEIVFRSFIEKMNNTCIIYKVFGDIENEEANFKPAPLDKEVFNVSPIILKLLRFQNFNNLDDVTPSYSLAYQEHLRWNAFHINYGYIPLPFDNISVILPSELSIYKDNVKIKEHACLIDYYDLDKYHDTLVERIINPNGLSFEDNRYGLYRYFGIDLAGSSIVDRKSLNHLRCKSFAVYALSNNKGLFDYKPFKNLTSIKSIIDEAKKQLDKLIDKLIADEEYHNPELINAIYAYININARLLTEGLLEPLKKKIEFEGFMETDYDNLIKRVLKMYVDTYNYDYQLHDNVKKIFGKFIVSNKNNKIGYELVKLKPNRY